MILDGIKVYIVEDNEDNIFILLTILRESGASVRVDWWAAGESRRIVEVLPVDVIILDLMLPRGRSGFSVFDEIRANRELAGVPIVAVSAADPTIAVPKARDQGFAGFISKPVDYDLFPRQIAAIAKGEQVWYTG